MINNIKINPVGLDKVIDTIQGSIFSGLTTDWGLDLNGYPRCYVLFRESGKTIEHFVAGIDYSGNLINAEENKFFFINEADYKKINLIQYETEIKIFFILNLNKAKTNILHRADEEVKGFILDRIERTGLVYNDKTIVTGFDRVFDGYNYKYTDDMQPYHYFRIDCTVKFELDGKC